MRCDKELLSVKLVQILDSVDSLNDVVVQLLSVKQAHILERIDSLNDRVVQLEASDNQQQVVIDSKILQLTQQPTLQKEELLSKTNQSVETVMISLKNQNDSNERQLEKGTFNIEMIQFNFDGNIGLNLL